MCSRYELNSTAREIRLAFDLSEIPLSQNKSEIRPTDVTAVIMQNKTAQLRPWGFKVDWTKQPMINARSETLTAKSTFRPWLQSRCVVPASAYFEWRTDEAGKKRKNRIWLPDRPTLAMAGICDGECFTIITCTPSRSIDHIHGRMPVLLAANDIDRWLSDDPFSQVSEVLKPYDGPISFDEEKPPPPLQADLFN